MIRFIIFLLVPLMVAACGGGYNPDKDNLSKALPVGESSYYDLGNNKGLMTEGLSSVASAANFEISFNLQDGGSLTLHTFTNSQLQSGFKFKFARQGGALLIQAEAQGQIQNWSSLFTDIDATQKLTFTMDVHNNEHPAHVMIWVGAKSSSMNHTNTIYNSAEDSLDLNYDSSPGNGSGRAWGFELINAQLTNARLSSPQDAHE
ncbi:hypothetical protein EZJ49_14570 [Bdellovibrio bacteriovorus]|uniref:hypothetical protein n=1 Tax=Bdellovibrio bacteriovorus TaxID=959 RepID=UPI0021CEEBB0|nr:hypothetical protein [Bdellovibrio bacteriovorus]UXR64289.1 hypothetical protein EZJ49_14570 [Bdellovibrio bacteriovorus]